MFNYCRFVYSLVTLTIVFNYFIVIKVPIVANYYLSHQSLNDQFLSQHNHFWTIFMDLCDRIQDSLWNKSYV